MPQAHRFERPRRFRLVGLLALLGATLLVGDLAASSVTRVEITLLGPAAVRVRVAEGAAMPCDSSDNRVLVAGKFDPGQVVATTTEDNCVCVQQTHEPFVDVNWSPAFFACRPVICSGGGRARRCVAAPDPTIRIEIRSR
jgi:hypothetical protein